MNFNIFTKFFQNNFYTIKNYLKWALNFQEIQNLLESLD